MKTHVTGQAAATNSQAHPEAAQVAGFRILILDLLFDSPVITAKEWATAVERTSNTQSPETLAKWYRNAVREIATREEAAMPVVYATTAQKEEITRLLNHPSIIRRHKMRMLLNINRLLADEASNEIARLTAYLAASFGGGAAVNAFGELMWGYSLPA